MEVAVSDEKKGWGETVLGWFVTRDEQADVSTDPGASSGDGNAAPPSVVPVSELPASPEGVVDFDAVFSAFGIDEEARDRVVKADGLLKTLPAGADAAVKRQIVEASLKAFGLPLDQMIETACEEIQALDAYQRKGSAALQAFCSEAEKRIVTLEQEIRSIRSAMEKEVADQKKALETCNEKKLEVQRILEFFGPEAVGRVVRDSPKLIDPGAAGAAGGRPPN
jgi:hypothetical protein